MTRPFLALAVATALATSLSACSSSGGSSDSASETPNTGGGGTVNPPVTGGGDQIETPPPPSGPPATSGSGRPDGTTKAGAYIGSFGFGTNGIYVIDDNNELFGLALMENGSAQSLFGNVGAAETYTGTLRVQTHDPSVPATAGVFGAGRGEIESTGEYNLQFTPGERIAGGEFADLTYATEGQLSPATAASVAGAWSSEYHFSDCSAAPAGTGCKLIFDVNFNGTTVSGSTSVEDNAGAQTRISPIEGVVSEYGDVLLLSFNWTDFDVTRQYNGTVFFAPDGTDRLIFLGETLARPTGNPTLGALLSRAAQ